MRNVLLHPAFIVVLSLTGLTACATSQPLAIESAPGDFENFMVFGNDAFENHDWGLARRYFLLAHEIEPENAGAVNQLALTDLLDDKDLGRGRRMIEQVLPAASPKDAVRLLDTQTRIALREGRYADAQAAQNEVQATALGEDPDFPNLLQETDESLARAPEP